MDESVLPVLMEMPPVKATVAYGHIALKTQFVHSELAATVPGAKFVAKGQDYWRVPLTWTSVVCLVGTFGDKLDMDQSLLDWINLEWKSRVEPVHKLRTGQGEEIVTDELLAQIDALCPPERSPLTPVNRRYQVAATLLLATAKRFLLLDEQGTGKMTEAAMALHLYPDTLPALIVSPASTIYTWQRELAVFGIESVILDGTAVQRRKEIERVASGDVKVAICSYGMVPKHSKVAGYGNIKLTDDHRTPKELNEIEWQCVIADEVHRASSPKTVQTRALWAVSENAPYRWGMTGTPIEQSPLQFWALLHFIDPESWPSKVKFQDRWVDYTENWFGGIDVNGIRADRMDEWKRVSEITWRRKMAEGLPPVENEMRFCTLKGKHLKMYKDMAKQLMAETGEDDAVLFAENHMVKAGRLMQMANSYIEIETYIDDDGEEQVEVTPIEPSPKLDLMMETLEDYEGTPLLLWFAHVKFMRLAEARLDEAGIRYAVIDGSMSAKARDKSVTDFQSGEVDILLLSVAAASEGITLTRAPVSINVQRPHSFIMDEQKAKRNHRIGSEIHDVIQVVDLVTKDTVEEDQIVAKLRKSEIMNSVIDPNATS